MTTKLTLTMEKAVIEKAKVYAKLSGRSLSDLVESYLQEIVQQSNDLQEDIPEPLKELFGIVNLTAEMDDKALIRSIMTEKHKS